ncbi:DUF637 domain-containing protein [Marinagarivorans algicola]|uniref:DUF637 domain-containing protein n=1 Tax=Marinagarivorans algicola TaxID=1513270 RepID=UPI0006B964B6|nr:DUF637 domain-containing protein [Marinagarivorans algicola]
MIFLTARPAKIMKPFRLNLFIKQCVAYALSFLLVFGSSAPSIADILTSESVEHSLAKNPVYINEPTSDYMYRTPAFVEWPTSRSKSLASMYDQLLTEDSTTIGEAKFVPIGVGDITTFIPIYPKYQYIGTPPVQARYVRTQIMALLGRNLIDGEDSRYATEAKQLDTLFSQAIAYAKNTDYRYGDVLNLDQEASGLSQDMIWPELRVVNGKSVIVPVVYLTRETVNNRRVIDSEAQLPKTTTIGQLNVVNTDIRFARDTLLEVTDLLATNSTITGTGNLKIVAEGNFDNASSIIETNCTDKQGRQLELGAGSCDLTIGAKNIKNHTIVYRYDLEHEQGSHYGQIAKLASHGGNVVLTALENIEFNGADATALNGAITLTAEGDIRIGTQELYSGSKSRYGSGTQTRSEVSFLQSHLTAEDTIKLIAKGEIVLDAAELVSDKGHIELLAGMGISVVDSLGVKQSQASGKFGKKKVDESVYQTVAIRSLLDAGKGITLSTDFGDIKLKAADITSGQGTSVNAKKGAVNLLMTTETDHYSYSSVKKGLFTTKTVSKGRNIESGVPNSIVGGFAVEALNGITVEYEGDPTLSTEEQLDNIAAMPGMEWIDDVRNSPDVDWNEILLAHEQWYDKTTSLSPAFAAVVAIAVAVATGGAGGAVAGAITSSGSVVASAVVTAGVNAFVSQAVMAGINGAVNGDIGGAMEDLASSDTLRSLAVAMVTAGAIAKVDATFFNVDSAGVTEATEAVENASNVAQAQAGVDTAINTTKAVAGGMSLTAQVGQAVTNAAISSSVEWAINGGNFSSARDSFTSNLLNAGVSAVGEVMATKIGQEFKAGNINNAVRYIAHAGAGCLLGVAKAGIADGEAGSGCTMGAGGAVVGEIVADVRKSATQAGKDAQQLESFLVEHGLTDPSLLTAEQQTQLKNLDITATAKELASFSKNSIDLAKLSGALAAFVAGADASEVNTAAFTAENAAEHNALFLIPIAIILLKVIDTALTINDFYDLHGICSDPSQSAECQSELEALAVETGVVIVAAQLIPGAKTFQAFGQWLLDLGLVSKKQADTIIEAASEPIDFDNLEVATPTAKGSINQGQCNAVRCNMPLDGALEQALMGELRAKQARLAELKRLETNASPEELSAIRTERGQISNEMGATTERLTDTWASRNGFDNLAPNNELTYDLPNGADGTQNGIDHLFSRIDGNGREILMVVDSKQFTASGTVSLGSTIDNGLQLSEDWINNVIDKTHDSDISDRLRIAVRDGRVETYIAAADKTAGTMSLIKVDANID